MSAENVDLLLLPDGTDSVTARVQVSAAGINFAARPDDDTGREAAASRFSRDPAVVLAATRSAPAKARWIGLRRRARRREFTSACGYSRFMCLMVAARLEHPDRRRPRSPADTFSSKALPEAITFGSPTFPCAETIGGRRPRLRGSRLPIRPIGPVGVAARQVARRRTSGAWRRLASAA